MSNRNFTLLVLAIVAAFMLILVAINNGAFRQDREAQAISDSEATVAEEDGRSSSMAVGSESRSMLRDRKRETSQKLPENPIAKLVGSAPIVKADANETTKRLGDAIRSGNVEQFSSFVAPAKFDRKSYDADPKEYLTSLKPGAVFQPAEPGDGVLPIRVAGQTFQRMLRGETVSLRVKADAGSPVTFTSFNLGQFENSLTSINVAADQDGVAETQFTATAGMIGLVNVLAVSPVNSGRAEFHISVGVSESPAVLEK